MDVYDRLREAEGDWRLRWERPTSAAVASFALNVGGGVAFLIGAASVTAGSGCLAAPITAVVAGLCLWRIGGGLADAVLAPKIVTGPVRLQSHRGPRDATRTYWMHVDGRDFDVDADARLGLEEGDVVAVVHTPVFGHVVGVAQAKASSSSSSSSSA